jgi:hypothetical protein
LIIYLEVGKGGKSKMNSLDKAVETQLNNIQLKTGKTLEELSAHIKSSGLSKHAEIRTMLMRDFGLGYGDANALVHYTMQSDGERQAEAKSLSSDDVVAELYAGPKAALRLIHDRLMAEIETFGPFEVLPKKGYISLRRKKQFAMLGPATNTRFELGLNAKNLEGDSRMVEQPAGGMCNYKIKLSQASEVDDSIIAWVKQAYDSSG